MGFRNSCPAVRRRRAQRISIVSNRRDIPEPEPEPEISMEGICPSLKESSKIAKKLN